MDIFFAFLVTGLAIVVLILKFDSKQTKKVKAVLKENRTVPQLLLLRATEKKLENLKFALRYEDVPKNMTDAASMANIYLSQREQSRLTKVQELKALTARYNNGEITLTDYNKSIETLLWETSANGKAYYMAS